MTKALKKSKKSKKRMSSVESQIPDKVRDKYKILLNKISKYNIDFKSNQDYVEILNQNEE